MQDLLTSLLQAPLSIVLHFYRLILKSPMTGIYQREYNTFKKITIVDIHKNLKQYINGSKLTMSFLFCNLGFYSDLKKPTKITCHFPGTT